MKKALLLPAVLMLSACSTTKRAAVTEEKTDVAKIEVTAKADSFRFESYYDSTKECRQWLDFDIIEYYPQTYTDSGGAVVQMVKAKKTAKAKKEESAILSKSENIGKNSEAVEAVRVDSSETKKETKETKKQSVDSGLWWLIAAVIVLMVSSYVIRKRVFIK